VKTTIDRISDSAAVLALAGELDASNYQELIDTGQNLYGEGVRTLVLDLSDLGYMSSSGVVAVHSLALVYRGEEPHDPEAGWQALHAVQADADSGNLNDSLRIAAPNDDIDAMLDRTGINRFLPVFADRNSALAG
jgi:anti-anti-sigma regulatory factor